MDLKDSRRILSCNMSIKWKLRSVLKIFQQKNKIKTSILKIKQIVFFLTFQNRYFKLSFLLFYKNILFMKIKKNYYRKLLPNLIFNENYYKKIKIFLFFNNLKKKSFKSFYRKFINSIKNFRFDRIFFFGKNLFQ